MAGYSRLTGHRGHVLGSVCAAALLVAGQGAGAQTASPSVTALDEVTVTAERGNGTINGASSTVSVKRAKDLQRRLVARPQDLVADEPGVSIAQKPNRTGATNYAIRGLTDNRVKLVIDGVPVPDYAGVLSSSSGALGAPGSFTRDVIDFDALKQAEIVRGPASALYGSDAIGGVVGFVTKDPEDFLQVFDKDWYLGSKIAYDSLTRGTSTTETVAGRAGPWSAMVIATGRWGHEVKPRTSVPQSAFTSTVVNPQDTTQNNVLAKLVYDTPDAGRWRLTVERFQKDVDTDLQSDRSGTINDAQGQDRSVRGRISLDWMRDLETVFADRLKAKVYYTGVERIDETDQIRSGGATTRWRKDTFNQDIFGAEGQFSKSFAAFGMNHALTYGATFETTKTTRLSEGLQTTGGVGTPTFGGDSYPLKRFPDTVTTTGGLYAQDVASLGAWRLIPALRIDAWQMDPTADALYTGASVTEQREISLSPKLGVTYDINETYRLFGQYAHGFRAPPYDAVNYGFTNSSGFYQILPNGSLKPESSNGFEAGLRGRFADGSSAQVSGFYNLYSDFINMQYVGMSGPYAQYQFGNLDKVRIWGLEAKGEWRLRSDWALLGSIAYANGRNVDTGAALDTVDPVTAVVGTRWSPTEQWTLEARVKGVGAKTNVSSPTFVTTSAYAVADVFASYEPSKHVAFNAGILNLFDKSYFNPADVAVLTSTGAALERYRAPGRSFSASLSVRF